MNFGKTYPKKSLLFWYQALLVISHQPSMYTFVEAKLDYTCSLVMPFELLKTLQIPQLPCKKNEKKNLPRWCRLSLTFSVLQRESCLPICYYHWSRDSQRAREETTRLYCTESHQQHSYDNWDLASAHEMRALNFHVTAQKYIWWDSPCVILWFLLHWPN